MPYLIVKDAQKFIEFPKKVFNAAENESQRPMRDQKIIMHSETMIGNSTIMFADSTEKYQPHNLFLPFLIFKILQFTLFK